MPPFIPLALFESVVEATVEHPMSMGKLFSATNGYAYFDRLSRLAQRLGPIWDFS